MFLDAWESVNGLPFGKTLFSKILKWSVPYSGSIDAVVEALEPGYARVVLKDKRKVRNHLHSIHAVALMNLAELSSGLALNVGLSKDIRGIVTRFSIDFLKKARGTLTSECRTVVPTVIEPLDHVVEVEVKDASDSVVCRAQVNWRLDKKSI